MGAILDKLFAEIRKQASKKPVKIVKLAAYLGVPFSEIYSMALELEKWELIVLHKGANIGDITIEVKNTTSVAGK